MNIVCEYCNYQFKNKSSLNYHQKNTKYCLEIQGKSQSNFKCDTCNKFLSSKNKLESHKNICMLKKLNELKEKELKEKVIIEITAENKNYKDQIRIQEEHIKMQGQQIKDLQQTIERMGLKAIERPTTTNNNTLNITSFMDFDNMDKIKNAIEDKLDINYVVDGQKGLAHFVKDNLLTDNTGKLLYICTDPSRNIFKYKDSTGEVKKDVEAKKLTNYILEGGIRTKSAVVGNDWCKDDKGDINVDRFNVMMEQQQSIMKLSDDNNSFKKELVSLTS
jgi:hypothetical protein